MERSRREILKTSGISAALATGLAGCASVRNALPGGGGGSKPLRMVPEEATVAARGNVTATLSDDAVATFVNEFLDYLGEFESYEGPSDKEDLLEEFQSRYDLDPRNAKTAVGFGRYPPKNSEDYEPYNGLWFDAAWSTEEILDAFDEVNYDFDEESHEGKTVYAPTKDYRTLWMGVLGSDAYVVGTEPAVKDAVEVSVGEMDSVDGGMSNAFGTVRTAPFRFVSTVPESWLPSESVQAGGSTIEPQQYATVDHVAGATYHEGSSVGVTIKMLTGDSSDAKDVKQAVDGAIAAAEAELKREELKDAMDAVSVSRKGSTVVVEATRSVEQATALVEVIASLFLGAPQSGEGGGGRTTTAARAPQAAFEIGYTGGDDGAATVTHDGGEAIERERLSFTVGGSRPSVRFDGSGRTWTAGETYRLDGNDGDSERGARVRVVWRSPDGDRAQILTAGTAE